MHTARYWEMAVDGRAQCRLCPHQCLIAEGHAGRCGVRVLRAGVLRATGYGMLSGAHTDPIEKKPLHHFYPGASAFSIGGWGCNLGCRFCQNWGISQHIGCSGRAVPPAEIIAAAMAEPLPSGIPVRIIAYTYNEPLINFEYVYDCARAARDAGIKNVLVTNGLVNPAPAAELLPLIDALNVDIKSMDAEFYRKYCGGTLTPVLDFIRQARDAGCHIEITNLVIPGLNDDDALFRKLAGWIALNPGKSTPLHLSAYHPAHKVALPPTPPATLERAAAICRRELNHVYTGNVSGDNGRHTYCPQCGRMQIERHGYDVRLCGMDNGVCAGCGRRPDFIHKV